MDQCVHTYVCVFTCYSAICCWDTLECRCHLTQTIHPNIFVCTQHQHSPNHIGPPAASGLHLASKCPTSKPNWTKQNVPIDGCHQGVLLSRRVYFVWSILRWVLWVKEHMNTRGQGSPRELCTVTMIRVLQFICLVWAWGWSVHSCYVSCRTPLRQNQTRRGEILASASLGDS